MKKNCSVAILVLASLVCFFVLTRCQAQDSPAPEEYELFEKANQEKDSAAKQKLILEFVQKYKKSSLDPNIAFEYAKFYNDYRAKGAWQQEADAAEKFLTHRPSDQVSILAASEAYQKLGNPQKLVTFGAKLYNASPSAATAYMVAKAYQSLKDGANFLKWAETTLKHDSGNLEMLAELITMNLQMQDFAKASAYAQRALQSLTTAKKPDGLSAEDWALKSNQMRAYAYGAIGEAAYVNNDAANAVKNFEAAIKANKRYDWAHYRLGFIYWKAGRTDDACMSFAKAYVLNGGTAADANKQLVSLMQTTRGNTRGVQALIQQARETLK